MRKDLIKNIDLVIEGLMGIKESLQQPDPQEEAPKTSPAPTKTPVKEETTPKATASNGEKENLEAMSYNDLKKLAKERGIEAKGTKPELIDKILAGGTAPKTEAPAKAEVKEEAPKKAKKIAKKEEEEVAPPSEPEEDADDDSDDGEDVQTRVEEEVKDMTDDEIKELLASVEKSTKGKRQALIARVVEAVEEGLIDLDAEDSDEDAEDQDDSEEGETDEEYEAYFGEATQDRADAMNKMETDIKKKVAAKKIKTADMQKEVAKFYGADLKEVKALDEEGLLTAYINMELRMIDDDGDTHDFEEPYFINERPVCCGYFLEEDEKGENLVCPLCGTAYEKDEE